MKRSRAYPAVAAALLAALCLTVTAAPPGAPRPPRRAASQSPGSFDSSATDALERGGAALGSVTLTPAKDNSIFSEGSNKSNGRGQYLFAGSTAFATARRALIAFDVADGVPAGARVTGVALTMQMSRTRAGTVPITLNRVLADWGEGASDADGEEGAGAIAEPGDATWAHRFFDSELWLTGGGDFAARISAALSVAGPGGYTWSSAEMIEDVQAFLDDPSTNYGWIVSGLEMTSISAKRFDSRDHPDPARRPTLLIEYALGPFAEFTVNDAQDANDAAPGDGSCETAAGNGICTLRAAVEETNALPGRDEILLPTGTYPLTLTGADEDAAASGDLDVTDSLDLVGTGEGVAEIDAGAIRDRVFHLSGNIAVRMSRLVLRGGSATVGLRDAGHGGGLLNSGGALTVVDSSVVDNAADRGAGLFSDGVLRLERSTLEGNVAAVGAGGLHAQGGSVALANVTVSGNTGEGLRVGAGATLALNNVTVAQSTAAGLYVEDGGSLVSANSLFSGNGGGSCGGVPAALTSLGHNLDDGDSCGLSGEGDISGADPSLETLADNGGLTRTHALAAGSVARDAASSARPGVQGACETSDQRGTVRPQGSGCDIGAFEAEPPANAPPRADAGEDERAECASPDGATLRLDGSGSSDPDSTPGTNDDIVSFEWFLGFGGPDAMLLGSGETLELTLPLGRHTVTLRVEDSFGVTDTDEVLKTVEDTMDPTLGVSVSPAMLWPPNGRFVPIHARVSAQDACGEVSVVLESISHDEERGNGQDDVRDADLGEPDFDFALRAARDGGGNGRTYTVTYLATDGTGREARASSSVRVPHDRGRGKAKGRRGAADRDHGRKD